jgi:DNA-binding transcriptional MerR regulator
MNISLSIGDFSRATHLTVKTLRHYQEAGLLEPAQIDPRTGYRRYTTDQIPTAQVIRRFRDVDMPLTSIQAVLAAPNVESRNELIATHLKRLESDLNRTRSAVASLRDLLQPPTTAAIIRHRKMGQEAAAAISEFIAAEDALAWLAGALGELKAALTAQAIELAGSPGGMFSSDFFSQARGNATIFIPCVRGARAIGRVSMLVVPAVELATIIHEGSHANIDIAYGALATHVTRHALGIDGPLREYYLVGPQDTPEESAWRTEIGWPIFQTG